MGLCVQLADALSDKFLEVCFQLFPLDGTMLGLLLPGLVCTSLLLNHLTLHFPVRHRAGCKRKVVTFKLIECQDSMLHMPSSLVSP